MGGGVISLIAMNSLSVVAQTLPSLPDVFVSKVTTTDNGVPDHKLDDVVVNADMLRNAKTGNPMKAIAWDEGCRSKNLHLYFEDGSGNSVQLDLEGAGNRPDIVLADDRFNPGVNYRAAVVFIDDQFKPRINFYLLKNLGSPTFSATFSSTQLLSAKSQHIPIYDTRSLPHIDMWSDANNTIAGHPGMYRYIATWDEERNFNNNDYNIFYADGDVTMGSINKKDSLPVPTFTIDHNTIPDVACFTEINSGISYAAFTYRSRLSNGGAALVVTELDMNTYLATAASPYLLDTFHSLFPRIESMSQYDSIFEPAKWQVATILLPGFGVQQCWGYNARALNTPMHLSSPFHVNDNVKSPCVAAGVKYLSGAPEIGNKQYTAGFYPWATQNLYFREITAVNNQLTTGYWQVNMNPLGPSPSEYFLADASKSFALSNCSNSGEWLLSAWYDGQDDGTGAGGHIWMKLSPSTNTMQFRTSPVSTLTGKKNILYPNPATNEIYINQATDYTIYNQQGQWVKKGNSSQGEAVDIAQLPVGNYLLKTANGNSYQFTKQ